MNPIKLTADDPKWWHVLAEKMVDEYFKAYAPVSVLHNVSANLDKLAKALNIDVTFSPIIPLKHINVKVKFNAPIS